MCSGSKYKIRCLREDYASIRKVLVPQGFIFDSAPVLPEDKLMVLTSPVNLSVTMTALTDAIQNLGWKAIVVRPMGATSWLIKSTEDPPGPHLAINDQVLSIRPYVAERPKFSDLLLPHLHQAMGRRILGVTIVHCQPRVMIPQLDQPR